MCGPILYNTTAGQKHAGQCRTEYNVAVVLIGVNAEVICKLNPCAFVAEEQRGQGMCMPQL